MTLNGTSLTLLGSGMSIPLVQSASLNSFFTKGVTSTSVPTGTFRLGNTTSSSATSSASTPPSSTLRTLTTSYPSRTLNARVTATLIDSRSAPALTTNTSLSDTSTMNASPAASTSLAVGQNGTLTPHSTPNRLAIGLGVGLGVSVLLSALFVLFACLHHHRRRHQQNYSSTPSHMHSRTESSSGIGTSSSPRARPNPLPTSAPSHSHTRNASSQDSTNTTPHTPLLRTMVLPFGLLSRPSPSAQVPQQMLQKPHNNDTRRHIRTSRDRPRVYPEIAYLYSPTDAFTASISASTPLTPPPRNPARISPASSVEATARPSQDEEIDVESSNGEVEVEEWRDTLDSVERRDFATAVPMTLSPFAAEDVFIRRGSARSYSAAPDVIDVRESLGLQMQEQGLLRPLASTTRQSGGSSRFKEDLVGPLVSQDHEGSVLSDGTVEASEEHEWAREVLTVKRTIETARSAERLSVEGKSAERKSAEKWGMERWSMDRRSADEGETLIARVDSERGARPGFSMGRWRGEPRRV